MGPTGAATELPENGTVLLCGGGLGNAVLFSIGKKARALGNRVIYFAGYKKAEDFYKREELEAAADVLVLSVDRGEPIPARRPSDRSFVGNIVEAMLAYATGRLGETPIPLSDAERLIVIGSDRMMAAVARARHGVLAPHLDPRHVGHRLDQLADAVHDERGLRPVPPEARRPGDRRAEGDRLLLLQPGPELRRDGLGQPRRAPAAEHGVREADGTLARSGCSRRVTLGRSSRTSRRSPQSYGIPARNSR